MFRAGDFERFKESRRAEVWDALLRRDNQLGGVKFEGGRAEDLLVLAAAAELDVGLGWEDGAVLQAAKMRASEKLAADGNGAELALVAAAPPTRSAPRPPTASRPHDGAQQWRPRCAIL